MSNIGIITRKTNDFYYSNILKSIHAAIHQKGHKMFVFCIDDKFIPERSINAIIAQENINGWIVLPRSNNSYLDILKKCSKNIVYLDNNYKEEYLVLPKYENSGGMAAEHLIEHEYKNIIFMGNLDNHREKLMFFGFKKVLKKNNLYNEDLIFDIKENNIEKLNLIIEKINDDTINNNALFSTNGIFTKNFISKTNRYKLAIPGNVAIIGYCDYCKSNYDSKVSLLYNDFSSLGFEVVNLVVKKINSENIKEKTIVINDYIKIHNSCGCKEEFKNKIGNGIEIKNDSSYIIKINNIMGEYSANKNLIDLALNIPFKYN
ncbi:MAG: substrate-binding domain-containing protein, partial [Clostridiales bacterium]